MSRDRRKRGRGVNATGRNDTEQYVALPYNMLRSVAWRSLSGSAVRVYLELHCRFHGNNNGKLSLSMDEASKLLKIGKSTAKNAFDDLIDKGFLVVTRPGQWLGRQATEYRLTTKQCAGHRPTNDWKHWRSGKKAPMAAKQREQRAWDSDGSLPRHIED